MELVHIPYLSIDHLKMGLIRSRQCRLNALSEDDALMQYLWPIVREMIKTALENEQHLIIEGCYIPWDWQKDFSADELNRIRFICLLMSDAYLCAHFDEVKKHADVIEKRRDDDCTLEGVRQDNARMRQLCALYDLPHVLSVIPTILPGSCKKHGSDFPSLCAYVIMKSGRMRWL